MGAAVGDIHDEAKIIAKDGKPAGDGPYFGVGFDSRTEAAKATTPFRLDSGRWATGPGEVVIDASTAGKQHYGVGSTVRIAAHGTTKDYEVVGVARFGTVKSLGTATAAVFDLRTAQDLFGKAGRYDSILVVGKDGTPAADVRKAISAELGSSAKVQTAQAQDRFTLDGLKMFIGIITTVLIVFGFVAVLVGAFTIFNTLSITVAQRSREFGLLRMVGAARRQVLSSVLIEALVIGVLASLIGLAAGFGIAKGLDAVFASMDMDLPEAGMVFASRTVIVSLLVGTVVTLLAGLVPAWRATRVPPVAALRDAAPGSEKVRLPARGVRLLASVIGRVAERIGGSAGRLARRNAMRNPGRTAVTASAMMIGVALVTLVTVVAQGLRDSTTGSLERRVNATHVVTGADGWSPTDPAVAKALAGTPGVQGVTSIRQDGALAFGDKEVVNSVDPKTVGGLFTFDWAEGDDSVLTGLGTDGAIVDEGWAKEHELGVGDRFSITSPGGEKLALTVRGIEDSPVIDAIALGPITISQAAFDGAFENRNDLLTFVKADKGADLGAVFAAHPDAKAQTKAAVQGADDRRHRLDARDLLRPAGAGRDRQPVRHRQHAGALDLRAHPRAGHAAGRRHEQAAGPPHGPPREHHHRADRRGARHRRRARARGGRHLGVRRRGPELRGPRRLADRARRGRDDRGRARGDPAGAAGLPARPAHGARLRVATTTWGHSAKGRPERGGPSALGAPGWRPAPRPSRSRDPCSRPIVGSASSSAARILAPSAARRTPIRRKPTPARVGAQRALVPRERPEHHVAQPERPERPLDRQPRGLGCRGRQPAAVADRDPGLGVGVHVVDPEQADGADRRVVAAVVDREVDRDRRALDALGDLLVDPPLLVERALDLPAGVEIGVQERPGAAVRA